MICSESTAGRILKRKGVIEKRDYSALRSLRSEYVYHVGDTELSPEEFLTQFVKMFTGGKIRIIPAEATDEEV